ncbi:MAG: PAS domain-containing protein [Bacillus subtilis]|nr:PAS domain-containing protein [Bacillus subtilis]
MAIPGGRLFHRHPSCPRPCRIARLPDGGVPRFDHPAWVRDRDRSILEQRDHSRGRLKNYIDASRIATWEWNPKTNVMTYNERWAQMLGYTLAELKPISVDTWKHLAHPDDVAASQEQVDQVLAGELEIY